MKVLITPRSFPGGSAPASRLLEDAGYEVVRNTTGRVLTEAELVSALEDVDGLLIGIDPVTEQVLSASPKLRAISKYGAGLDNIDLLACEKRRIPVARAAGSNAQSVAELALAYMFQAARHIVWAVNELRSGRQGRQIGAELFGKTVGILGLGQIGRRLMRMTLGLGMTVLGYDPFISHDDPELKMRRVPLASTPDEVFSACDFISLHLPLTEETRHMISDDLLGEMRPSAVLINTARGELVDEDALYRALSEKRIAAYAADVFSTEPPPADHPLLKLPNFLLTTHIGALTREANENMSVISAKNLLDLLYKKV